MSGLSESHVRRGLLAVLALVCALTLSGCNVPPALSKTELDSGTIGPKHPKIEKEPPNGCRGCHKEQPEIKK